MFSGINAIEFNRRFKTNDDCYEYLLEHKWGNGFSCSRCGCTIQVKGRTSHHKRCQRCRYDESVTAHTLFHAMKMPILKAFHMVFRVTAKKKGMSTVELGCEVSVQQKTAWLFKRKIQVGMKQDHHYKVKGQEQVDKSLIGMHVTRLSGKRNRKPRMAMVIAAAVMPDGTIGNLRMHEMGNFQALQKKDAVKDPADSTTQGTANNKASFKTPNTATTGTTTPPEKGPKYIIRYRHLMFFKNWVVGIHHRWSKNHLYAYADEYVYRLNNRDQRKKLFNMLISDLMHQAPHPLPVIKRLCARST